MHGIQIRKLKNAFGIKELNVNTDHNILDCNLIYAANGVFKTSFSKTLDNLINDERVYDRITNTDLEYDIFIDGKPINSINLKDKVVVFNNQLMKEENLNDLSEEIGHLAVINELKDRISRIHKQLKVIDQTISQMITSIGYPENVIDLLIDDENAANDLEKTKSLINFILSANIISDEKPSDYMQNITSNAYAKIDNKKVRDSANEVKIFIENQQKETIFDDNFTVFAATEFLASLKQTSFINVNKRRGIILGNELYLSYEKFEGDLQQKIQEIMGSEITKKKLEELKKIIGKKSKDEKRLGTAIFKDVNIVNMMAHSRREWIASDLKHNFNTDLSKLGEETEELQNEITKLAVSAESMVSEFEKAVAIYEDRFNPIFSIKIDNKKLASLGIELPNFVFSHKNTPTVDIDEMALENVLSDGEQTAYNTLKFIVMYERIKSNKPIVVLDDVVDSFDYGNKYAFIEYIIDMVNDDQANLLVLTNNFDFFRNVKLRVKKLKPLIATINKTRQVITLSKADDLFFDTTSVFKMDNERKVLLALPFAREIGQYQGCNKDYLNYFHIKANTDQLSFGDLITLIKNNIKNSIICSEKLKKPCNYLEKVYSICSEIIEEDNMSNFDISSKIILSLGIRLKLEQILIRRDMSILDSIKGCQTRELFKKRKPLLSNDFIRVSQRILVSTPEFVHINAFMYEPLIDIPKECLTNLFNRLVVFERDSSKIWK